MTRNLQNKNQVSVCHKNSCLHAAGDNAKIISIALAIMLILIGYAAVTRSA